ncbi:Bax inhibitor-1/YccA family protein [Streptomyces sp. NBC_00687]|uniref:Bax inhibitor-1/YccA family protein n=1 Tax=Streptomyces sp. NBC_00687 TaxID=2975807 RepID=UPI00225BF3E0|nr:Bax inhibitor-1/YccA family protein [Streptomyces sp. NBC_00687]MCX4912043.1 Bax inhibitor-1/YccA family protein [Streptomyces sp. NBC_00687]
MTVQERRMVRTRMAKREGSRMPGTDKRSLQSSNPLLRQWKAQGDRPGSQRRSPSAEGSMNTGASPSLVTIDLRKDTATAYDSGFSPPAPHTATMTMDDVIVRTAMTLGTVILTAVLAWILLPVDQTHLNRSYSIAGGAALTAFILSMAQAFKSRPAPALILTYAAFEGVFLGVISATVSTYISPGVVIQAVLGTMAVFAGVLIAYKVGWIRVTQRFQGFVIAAGVGFLLLTAANFLFSAFSDGEGLGFRSGGLGIIFGVIGVVLAAAFLALHFRQVEDGIEEGAPRSDAWLAAFGLTLTLVWLYVELVNLLTLVREEDVF